MKLLFNLGVYFLLILNFANTDAFNRAVMAVDFDRSMGKDDPYMNKFYRKMQKRMTSPNDSFWKYIRPYSGIDLVNLCKKMYQENSPAADSISENYRIPPIIHQIWVGGKPFPEKYKKWQKTWQSLPGWEYKLWTDKDAEEFGLENKELYFKEQNAGIRADIFRAEILHRYGGVYLDTDFECLEPEIFNLLHKKYDFYAGIQPVDISEFQIGNGIIGSIRSHPILKGYIDSLKEATPLSDSKGFVGNVINRGPGLFSKMILLHANKGFCDLVLPPTFFYALSPLIYGNLYTDLPNSEERFEKLKQATRRPESAAIHWWEGSWDKPEAWVKMEAESKANS